MNKQLRKLLGALTVCGLVLLPATAQAADLRAGERVNIGVDQTVTDDIYMAGGSSEVSGTVNGDVFTAGGNVTISGSVSDDVHAVGGTVTLLGDVNGDARLVGGTLTIAGSIAEDLIALGGQTQISAEQIGGDLVWLGGQLSLNTPINGDVTLTGGEVYLNAPITGDVQFRGEELVLESGANIEGNLTYRSPQEAQIAEGATIAGEVNYEQTEGVPTPAEKEGAWLAIAGIAALIGLLVKLTGALVIGLGFKGYAQKVVSQATAKPFTELGRGFVGLVVLPIAAIVLMMTVLGLGLGGALLFGYIALLIVAQLVAPIIVGSYLYKQFSWSDDYEITWLAIVLGALTLFVIGLIPFIGWLVKCLIVLVTLGALLQVKWEIAKDHTRN